MQSRIVCALASALAASGCSSSDTDGSAAAPHPGVVVQRHAQLVLASYVDAVEGAKALQSSVDAFVDAPTVATLEAARQAWKASRPAYLQTEVFRFYGGPIDDESTGPEGRINGWPLDEAYIDYVVDDEAAGIVNHPADFPTLDVQTIADANELGGEKNLSAGYHAIEFLLWGQDLSATGPGARPATDYLDGASGTHENAARRGAYLQSAAALLVADLEQVRQAWTPGADHYATSFVGGDPKQALAKILVGMGSLAGAELSKERLNNAYETKDQEEEHSCFSDNTHVDHVNDALGIRNVYLGAYGDDDGPGLDDLVRAVDPALDARMKTAIDATVAALDAIPEPFDQAIGDDAPGGGREKIAAALDELAALTVTVVEVATALDVTINLEE